MPQDTRVVAGRCILCGCTDGKACSDQHGGTCWWVDDSHTICSFHPQAEIKRAVERVKELRAGGESLCPTSGAETTDPYLRLAGDTGEAGALATCGLCGARLRLEAGVPRPRFPRHHATEVLAVAPPATPDVVRAHWTRAKAEILEVERRAYELAAELEREAPPGAVDAEIVRRLRQAGSELISASARAGVLARGGRL